MTSADQGRHRLLYGLYNRSGHGFEAIMPKIKTKRAAAKRFRKTATGKYKMKHAYMRHQLTHKPRQRKRHLRGSTIVPATDSHRLDRLLPYL
jgi:large subunit ribosomal protein L35